MKLRRPDLFTDYTILPLDETSNEYKNWEDVFRNYAFGLDLNDIYKIISTLIPDPNFAYKSSPHVNSKDFTLLMSLTMNTRKYPELLQIISNLIDLDPVSVHDKNDWGLTAFMLACANSNEDSTFETVQLLLEKGSYLEERDKQEMTALILAAVFSEFSSSLETVKFLITSGANVNVKSINGDTALMQTIYVNPSSYETVKFLIESGADVNVKNNNDNTALSIVFGKMLTAISYETVELLVKSGADMNILLPETKISLLQIIIYNTNTSIIYFNVLLLFISMGADLNILDAKGYTPLIYTLLIKDFPYKEKVIHTLLISGANPNLFSNSAFVPLDVFLSNKQADEVNRKILKTLIEYGARSNLERKILYPRISLLIKDIKEEILEERGVKKYFKTRFDRSIIAMMKQNVNKFIFALNGLGATILSGLNALDPIEWDDVDSSVKMLLSLQEENFREILRAYTDLHTE